MSKIRPTNKIAMQQSEKWLSEHNQWLGAWDICQCTTYLERVAHCISSLFHSIAIGGPRRYQTIDRLIHTYKQEAREMRSHPSTHCPIDEHEKAIKSN